MWDELVPVLKREAGVDITKASDKVVLECLYGSLSSIAAMVPCRSQLIGDVVRVNL